MDWAMVSLSGGRPVNEDSISVVQTDGTTCFVVADGLGGHGKGEVASRLATEAFEKTFETQKELPAAEKMRTAFLRAQADILAEQRKTGDRTQMKTTVCALTIHGESVTWGHIGDSRIYGFDRGRVKMRTLDHSVPQMLVMAKELREREIRNHPDRNKLLRVLGVAGDEPRFEIAPDDELRNYQAFLLCSDGFWELIIESEMRHTLRKSASAQEWLDAMCRIVTERGAEREMDNYSAIAVYLQQKKGVREESK